MLCLFCKVDNDENAKFCINCGNPLCCTKCGYKNIESNMKFCPNCGNKINYKYIDNPINNNSYDNSFYKNDLNYFENLINKSLNNGILLTYKYMSLNKLIYFIKTNELEALKQNIFDFKYIKEQFLNHIKSIIKVNYKFYNDFIKFITNKYIKYTIRDDAIEEYSRIILNRVQLYITDINDSVYNIVENIPTIISLTNELNPKFGDKVKNGLAYCVGGAASIAANAIFPVAAPLAFDIVSVFLPDDKGSSDKHIKLNNLVNTVNDNIRTIENNYNKIINNLIIYQKEDFEKIKELLIHYFNDILNNNIIESNMLNEYVNKYKVKLKDNIEITNEYENEISTYDESLRDFFMSQKMMQRFSSVVSDMDIAEFFKTINERNNNMKTFLLSHHWLNFDSLPLNRDYLMSLEKFDDIISRYNMNNNFEALFSMCNSSLYVNGSGKKFNYKKINNFSQVMKFSGEFMIYYDSTFFGKGDEGFALNKQNLYYNINSNKDIIPLINIDSVDLDNDKLVINYSTSNGKKELIFDVSSIYDKQLPYFADCVQHFIELHKI